MTGSGEALDRSMVRREQAEVQKQLDQFKGKDPEGYGAAIKEINALAKKNSVTLTSGIDMGADLGDSDAEGQQATEGKTTTQSALSITSCGTLSGIFMISLMTFPAFATRSSSFS
jgi:hypothetical protein